MESEKEINKMSYTEAKRELEELVSYIESGKPDVDILTAKVKRASELIAFCKEKLTGTDKELQKILNDIE